MAIHGEHRAATWWGRNGRRLAACWWPLSLLTAVFLLSFHEIWDRDIFFHLATGKAILEQGGLPAVNIFTFPKSSLPFYPNPAWLFDVLLALVYRNFGLTGAILGKCLVLLVLYGVLLRMLRGCGATRPWAVLLLFVAAMASALRFNERPEVFTCLFLGLYLWLLQRHRAGRAGAVWWLPAIMLAWTNMHAGFIFGLICLGLVAAGEWLTTFARGRWRALAWEPLPPERLRQLTVAAALSGAASLLTPRPLTNYRFLFQHLHVTDIVPVAEYAAPDPRLLPWFYVLLGLLVVLGIAARGRAKPPLPAVLPLVFFAALAFSAVRFVPLFAIACLPWAGMQLAALQERLAGICPQGWWLRRVVNLLLPAGLVLVVLAFPPVPARHIPKVDRSWTPVDGFRFLNAASFRGNLYNSLSFGAAGMFYLYPQHRLFQTSYIQVEEDLMEEAYRSAKEPQSWQVFLDRYAIEVALIDIKYEEPTPDFFPPQKWALVYFDDVCAIFIRRGGANEALVRRYEYRAVHPARFFGSREGTAAVDFARLDMGLAELDRALEWSPQSPLLYLMRGFYLNAVPGRESQALADFTRAAESDPTLAPAFLQRGLLYLEQGANDGAIESLRAYVRLVPADPLGYVSIARGCLRKGDTAAALRSLRQAERRAGLKGVLLQLGNLQREEGDLDGAIDSYRQALAAEPEGEAEALNELGVALGMKGELAEALRAFERALELRPDFVAAAENRAYALQLLRQGDRP